MTSSEDMIERVALIFARYADNFLNAHASEPSVAAWEDFSPREQLMAKAAARAAIEAFLADAGGMIEIDEDLDDDFHVELQRQQAFSIGRYGKIALATGPFIDRLLKSLRTSLTGDTK